MGGNGSSPTHYYKVKLCVVSKENILTKIKKGCVYNG